MFNSILDRISSEALFLSGLTFLGIEVLSSCLLAHLYLHPACVEGKQTIEKTSAQWSKMTTMSCNDTKIERWISSVERFNVNNYIISKEMRSQVEVDNGREYLPISVLNNLEELILFKNDDQATPMMKVINHQKRTREIMSIIKQLMVGFEWSERTDLEREKSTLEPILYTIARVQGSPVFPRALFYSEIRDLKDSEEWRLKLLNPVVLAEVPWKQLYLDDKRTIYNCVWDLQIYMVQAMLFPIALSILFNNDD